MSFLLVLYVISGYLFIIFNLILLFMISLLSGAFSVIFLVVHVMSTRDKLFMMHWQLVMFLLLIMVGSALIYYALGYIVWAESLLLVILYPVATEEIFFRYYIQQILLKEINPVSAIIIQSSCYSMYYTRFLIIDNGRAFPFPYNIIMLISIFGMGTFYGVLTYLFKNIYVSSIVHFTIWTLFPLISIISPGIASSIIPS